jgi:type II secretory pathway component PulC
LAGAKAYSIKECGGKGSRGFSFEDEDEDSKEAPDACNNIASVGEIKRIESECVYFYNTGSRRCEFMRISPLSVCNDRGDFKANTPLQEPQAPEKPGESIKKTGASTFEVERNDLNGLLDNLGQLLTQARVVPDVVDGKPAFKFVMVQPNSFFEKIGFKVGDVVTKINGSEVSIEKATEFIGKLRTDSQFNVEGTRDGSSFSYDYNVKR